MKKSKFQVPSSKEASSSKYPKAIVRFGDLVFGISLEFGTWNLGLCKPALK